MKDSTKCLKSSSKQISMNNVKNLFFRNTVKMVYSYIETANSGWLGQVIKHSNEFFNCLLSSTNNLKKFKLGGGGTHL